jgi:hypothetical protein
MFEWLTPKLFRNEERITEPDTANHEQGTA